MPDPHATPDPAAKAALASRDAASHRNTAGQSHLYQVVETAIRITAMRGGHGYDELARAVVQALYEEGIG